MSRDVHRLYGWPARLLGGITLCMASAGFAQTPISNDQQASRTESEVALRSTAEPAGGSGTHESNVAKKSQALPVDVAGWITRLRRAAQQQSYTGMLVVTTDIDQVAGSRVWHACHEDRQIERVDAMDSPSRTVFRRDGEMRTFLHASHRVIDEAVTSTSIFPYVQPGQAERVDAFYFARRKGSERIAGHDADVVWLVPRDGLRFGYRVWSERSSGLVLRVQTVQSDGRVLEQTSFLQVDLTAPVSFERLSQTMDDVSGYRVLESSGRRNDAQSVPWTLKQSVPGFALQGCRTAEDDGQKIQCAYADGLASVSVFVESFSSGSPPRVAARWASGATRAIARPLDARTWLTVVGEVPYPTLILFAERLERTGH